MAYHQHICAGMGESGAPEAPAAGVPPAPSAPPLDEAGDDEIFVLY